MGGQPQPPAEEWLQEVLRDQGKVYTYAKICIQVALGRCEVRGEGRADHVCSGRPAVLL